MGGNENRMRWKKDGAEVDGEALGGQALSIDQARAFFTST